MKYVQKERANDPERKYSSFDLVRKFYREEKFSSYDLSSFPTFSARNQSLLKKHLDHDLFDELKGLKTSTGFGLESLIKPGVFNHLSTIGVLAPDAESYQTFSPLLNRIISDIHTGFDLEKDQSIHDISASHLRGENPDPEGKYIISTSVSVSRNLEGYPFPIGHSRKDRQDVERKIVGALQSLRGDLQGKYYPLSFLNESDRSQLELDGFLFQNNDKNLESAGGYKDWPEGRGVFHSEDKKFVVLVNNEDDLKILSTQMGGNFRETFSRLSTAATTLENKLKFQHDEHYGYFVSSPCNLGGALNATVQIKLPLLSQNPDLQKWAQEHKLYISPVQVTRESEGGIVNVSTNTHLGTSEVQAVQSLFDGVKELISWESRLEAKESN